MNLPSMWRALITPAVMAATIVMFPAAARADSQTPGALSWITVNDSRGISIWNYELSLDRGDGLIPSPGKMFWSALVDLAWGPYRGVIAVIIWIADWVFSLSWLDTVAAPFLTVGDAMQTVVNQIGVGPTFLLVTLAATSLWVAHGRWATGLWEITVSLLIGALAVGIFANPVRKVVGPDGWIATTQANGQELAAVLTGQDPDDAGDALSKAMVDAFIRKPAQLINFGEVLDGGPCEKAYTKVVQAGPYGGESTIRDAVKDCNSDLGEYAENPSIGMATSAIVLAPGAGFLALLIGSIAGSVLVAGVTVLWEGAKGSVTMLVGTLPGAARGPFFMAVGTVSTRLALLFVSSVFLGLVTMLVDALLASGDGTARVFAIVDVMLLVSWYVWRRQRQRLRDASARIASVLAKRPGASPVGLPKPGAGPSVGPVISKAMQVAQLAATRRAATAAGNIDNRTLIIANGGSGRVPPPPGRSPGGSGGAGGGRLLPPAGPAGGGGPRRPLDGGGSGGRGRKLVGAGVDAGLLLASGGTSAVAKTARTAHRANAARKASRAALQDWMVRRPEAAAAQPGSGPVVEGRVVASRYTADIRPDGRVVLRPSEQVRDAS